MGQIWTMLFKQEEDEDIDKEIGKKIRELVKVSVYIYSYDS